jgi:cobalt/nickel transport system ATP-binding protein
VGEGIVRVEGVELTRSRLKEIRSRVGLIFQSSDDQLFMPTLRDDLAFGPINLGLDDDEVGRRVREAASEMGLVDMLDRAPHHLSMGQKRNAAIASVLAMRPVVLLMDEPSSNLDPRSRKRLIETLQDPDAAMLIASHDRALVERLCRRVMVIDEGRIVADGPMGDILNDAELMEKHGLSV